MKLFSLRNKRKIRLATLFVVSLFALSFALVSGCAKDTSGDMTSFVSESGFLNLSYPADWSLSVDENGVVAFANSEATIERMNTGQLQTGDIGVSVVLMPTAFLDVFGGSVSSSDEALQFILVSPLHRIADPDNTQVGDISAVELNSSHDASQFSLSNATLEGKVFAIILTEGVIAYVTVVSSAGEYANAEDLILSIIGTIEYTGTKDDLWDELLFYPLPV